MIVLRRLLLRRPKKSTLLCLLAIPIVALGMLGQHVYKHGLSTNGLFTRAAETRDQAADVVEMSCQEATIQGLVSACTYSITERGRDEMTFVVYRFDVVPAKGFHKGQHRIFYTTYHLGDNGAIVEVD